MCAQGKNTLYCPMLIKLPLSAYTINMNYAEVLDETCVDMNHVHDSYEICFCLENRLAVSAGGRDHTLLPGDFLLIMPGTPHNVIFEPDYEKKYFLMVFDVPHIDLEEYDDANRPFVTKINQLSRLELVARGGRPVEKISAIVDKMETELHNKNMGWLFLFRGHCVEFLFYCLREILAPVTESPKEVKNLNLAIEIKKYIQSNYSRKITLQDISDALHTSPRHAQRIFTDYFGVSYAKTLNLYRMNYAKNYLTRTNLSIDEIAERVGLSSAQAMSRLFREHERMSVNEYRVMQKKLMQSKQAAYEESVL